jgi:hypothetical protein
MNNNMKQRTIIALAILFAAIVTLIINAVSWKSSEMKKQYETQKTAGVNQ